jgi:hypothetical protein
LCGFIFGSRQVAASRSRSRSRVASLFPTKNEMRIIMLLLQKRFACLQWKFSLHPSKYAQKQPGRWKIVCPLDRPWSLFHRYRGDFLLSGLKTTPWAGTDWSSRGRPLPVCALIGGGIAAPIDRMPCRQCGAGNIANGSAGNPPPPGNAATFIYFSPLLVSSLSLLSVPLPCGHLCHLSFWCDFSYTASTSSGRCCL